MTFVVQPSRKPAFWAEVEKLNRAEKKAATKQEPKKTAKPLRESSGKPRRAKK